MPIELFHCLTRGCYARLCTSGAVQRLLEVYTLQQKDNQPHTDAREHVDPCTAKVPKSTSQCGLSHDLQTITRGGRPTNAMDTARNHTAAKSTRRSVESLHAAQIERGKDASTVPPASRKPTGPTRFRQGARTYIAHTPTLRATQLLPRDTPPAC